MSGLLSLRQVLPIEAEVRGDVEFLFLACLRGEWMIDHASSPLWQWEVSTSDGYLKTFMGAQLQWISIMHLVMYEREFFSQISRKRSVNMTFRGIYHQTPCQWPVWCMCEFHRNTKGKQSRRTHERISLCRENREGERKEDQSDSKIYFQAEHIGYKGMKRDIKVPKQTIIIIILLKLKRGMEERLTAIEWDRKAWSDGFMRRIMEGCPFFSSVELLRW